MLRKIGWLLATIMIISLCNGCDSGSSSSDDEYVFWTFINDTNKRVQIYRNGGQDWKGDESFELDHKGEERTVELDEKDEIKFGYVVLDGGEVEIEYSGSTIFIRND